MNISKLGLYASGLNLGCTPKTEKDEKGTLPEIPELKLPDISNVPFRDWMAARNKNKATVEAYQRVLNNLFFDTDGKLLPEVKKFFDEQVFPIQIRGKNSGIIHTTIRDYLRASIHEPQRFDTTLYHGTLDPANIDSVIKNGFDVNKINSTRVRLGPGFYFSDYGSAMNYGSVLQARAKGAVANADNAFYENVVSVENCNKVGNFIGLTEDKCNDQETCSKFQAKLINEYARQFIIENLGLDALSGWGGNGPGDSCICVVNPNILSDIKKA